MFIEELAISSAPFYFMKNVIFHTLGCKLNYTESSSISEQFRKKGFRFDPSATPDIFIINTCSVTQNAERECRQIVRRMIRKNPGAFIVIIGCYAQIRSFELAKIDGVDLILGSKEKFFIFDYEKEFIKKGKPVIIVSDFSDEDIAVESFSSAEDRTRAFLKVQDGCDYKCSYCTIPMTRGKSRSLDLDTIERNIIHIAERGFKEVVITGVNISDYGKKADSDFMKLLTRIDKIKEIPRIRISSIEPNNLTDNIIEFIASSERICPHFHIPLQSGDDNVLKAMQRRYLTAQFAETVNKINRLLPKAGLGFDVIVGFPSETTDFFNNTYNFLCDLDFTYLHVFSFSPRPMTKAASIKNVSSHIEIEKRSQKLHALSLRKKLAFLNSQLDQKYEVLFEEAEKDGRIFGFTGNYIRVGIEKNESLINKIVPVLLTEIKEEHCVGKYLC